MLVNKELEMDEKVFRLTLKYVQRNKKSVSKDFLMKIDETLILYVKISFELVLGIYSTMIC